MRNALTNAVTDVKFLQLSFARLQQAIDTAVPGADMSHLHDLIMSMRVSFEASL